jgi:chromosome segregation ATPase
MEIQRANKKLKTELEMETFELEEKKEEIRLLQAELVRIQKDNHLEITRLNEQMEETTLSFQLERRRLEVEKQVLTEELQWTRQQLELERNNFELELERIEAETYLHAETARAEIELLEQELRNFEEDKQEVEEKLRTCTETVGQLETEMLRLENEIKLLKAILQRTPRCRNCQVSSLRRLMKIANWRCCCKG